MIHFYFENDSVERERVTTEKDQVKTKGIKPL